MEEEKYIVALETSSSKIKGAIGTVDPHGHLTVHSIAEEKLIDGIRYGCIRNVAEVTRAARTVIDRLQHLEAPRRIDSVYIGINGRSTASSITNIERRLPHETEVTEEMISDIFAEALSQPLHERTVIDATPREIKINGVTSARPIGDYGSTILASLNLISCRTQLLRNLSLVINERLKLSIADKYITHLSVADLVLLNDEKRLGCALVNLGAETTTVAVYKNGALQRLTTLPIGSRNITRDIATLNYIEERAEELKITQGNAMPTTPDTPAIDRPEINAYVSARAGEIIANITEQIKQSGHSADTLPRGIILAGNGAKLKGFIPRLEAMSQMQVRTATIATPHIRIANPSITPYDSIDVIALLATASQRPIQCMSRPTPQTIEPPVDPIFTPQPKPKPQPKPEPQPEPEKKPTHTPEPPKGPGIGKRLFDSMRDRIAELFTEHEDDDE